MLLMYAGRSATVVCMCARGDVAGYYSKVHTRWCRSGAAASRDGNKNAFGRRTLSLSPRAHRTPCRQTRLPVRTEGNSRYLAVRGMRTRAEAHHAALCRLALYARSSSCLALTMAASAASSVFQPSESSESPLSPAAAAAAAAATGVDSRRYAIHASDRARLCSGLCALWGPMFIGGGRHSRSDRHQPRSTTQQDLGGLATEC